MYTSKDFKTEVTKFGDVTGVGGGARVPHKATASRALHR